MAEVEEEWEQHSDLELEGEAASGKQETAVHRTGIHPGKPPAYPVGEVVREANRADLEVSL